MRGFKGMFQFMLVLEYDVPAAFFHVRKREARKPPSGKSAILKNCRLQTKLWVHNKHMFAWTRFVWLECARIYLIFSDKFLKYVYK